MHLVREFPEIGVDSSDVRKGYRRIGLGSHMIYYIIRKSEIYVIRVLHGRMDAGCIYGELKVTLATLIS